MKKIRLVGWFFTKCCAKIFVTKYFITKCAKLYSLFYKIELNMKIINCGEKWNPGLIPGDAATEYECSF